MSEWKVSKEGEFENVDVLSLQDDDLRLLRRILFEEHKIRSDRKQMELRLGWRVGDTAYFVYKGKLRKVQVKKLNRKTMRAVDLEGGVNWRVRLTWKGE